MAVLEHATTGERILLRPHHVFGRRSVGIDSQIIDAKVSQIHCAIRWEGDQWSIQDFSRNGTFLEQKKLTPHQNYPLSIGQSIQLAGSEAAHWIITSVEAPKTSLIPLHDNGDVITLETFSVLPDTENPQISIYKSESGTWFCETSDNTTMINDGDVIQHEHMLWRFMSADPIDSTRIENQSEQIHQTSFDFNVSRDEEHVFLTLNIDGEVHSLGERVHHYLLLTLARKRKSDSDNLLDEYSQGWIELEELSAMLGIDRAHLNIQIYRARKQISQVVSHLSHLPSVFERRAGSIRFGYSEFSIQQGAAFE